MKLHYEAPKGIRFKGNVGGVWKDSNGTPMKLKRMLPGRKGNWFLGVDIDKRKSKHPELLNDYWWSLTNNVWKKYSERLPNEEFLSSFPGYADNGIWHVNSFKRWLKKWKKYMPEGTVFRLSARVSCFDVYGKI